MNETESFLEASAEACVFQLFDYGSTLQTAKMKLEELRDRDELRATKALAKRIESGSARLLHTIPQDFDRRLTMLARKLPNFDAPINYLRYQFAADGGTGAPLKFDPILLNGPPGIGKTLFCSELASAFGVGLQTVRLENAQSNSALAGSEEFWSNSKPGVVFNQLVVGTHGNPVFFVDEVEKACAGFRSDPLSALYSLLEVGTSRSFVDLAFPWITLDASHLNWVLASNETESLPLPIRSRVRQFEIPEPTPVQSYGIVIQIFRDLQSELAVAKELRLTCAAIEYLSSSSPRQVRKLLREAVGKVAFEERRRIGAGDFPVGSEGVIRRRSSIGFLD